MPGLVRAGPVPYRFSMDRRRFLLTSLASTIAAPLAVEAQARSDTGQVHVGIVGYGSGVLTHVQKTFREALAAFGYVTGQNLILDERYANGRRERIPGSLQSSSPVMPASSSSSDRTSSRLHMAWTRERPRWRSISKATRLPPGL
jgi:hypothetical protein